MDLWSTLYLENGFQQMPLVYDRWHLTNFTTPWRDFEWQLLPMG